VFGAIDELRIPVQYLANMLTAGDEAVVRRVLKRLAAMRSHMRAKNLSAEPSTAIAHGVNMTADEIEDMYRLLAIAKYEERYVIPKAHREVADNLTARQGGCGLDFAGGPGSCGPGVDEAEGEAAPDLLELAITRHGEAP
jgi:nitrate reductase beta subunit